MNVYAQRTRVVRRAIRQLIGPVSRAVKAAAVEAGIRLKDQLGEISEAVGNSASRHVVSHCQVLDSSLAIADCVGRVFFAGFIVFIALLLLFAAHRMSRNALRALLRLRK